MVKISGKKMKAHAKTVMKTLWGFPKKQEFYLAARKFHFPKYKKHFKRVFLFYKARKVLFPEI